MTLESLGQEIYDGAASFGRFNAIIGLVIAHLISLALIAFSVYLWKQKDRHTETVTATISKADCNRIVTDQSVNYDCHLTLDYQVDGTPYSSSVHTQSGLYQPGSPYSIRFNPSNPSDITNSMRNSTWALILLGIGLVLILCSWIGYYVVDNFQIAAAASGLGALHRAL
jgi:hypothetical protein